VAIPSANACFAGADFMTDRLSADKDPFSIGDAGFAEPDAESPSTGDWVEQAVRSGGGFELYFDEITGRYEVRRLDGQPPLAAEDLQAAPKEPMDFAILSTKTALSKQVPPAAKAADEAQRGRGETAQEVPLLWASFAGPVGSSPFHGPLGWTLGVIGAADFSPLPALGQSRGGSAWPLDAAA